MECDVLIIGSGPAGASAARRLSGSGLRVIVLERLSEGMFPRYHSVCGEAVSDRMLRRTGVGTSCSVAEVDKLKIGFPGGAEIAIPVKGHIMDRPAMLRSILSGSDAERIRGTALSVSEKGDGFVVGTTAGAVSCRYLIGADGAHSVVRRDIFGTSPAGMLPVVNTIRPGDGGRDLGFTVEESHGGFYAWRFPSKEGTVSVGFPKGADRSDDEISRGARHLPFGGVPEAVHGNALLVGDAAGLANALCYGGIGAAMESGIRAAGSVIDGNPGKYAKWYSRTIYRDPHFLRAHESFAQWTDEDIADAMVPFRSGYSLFRGFLAVLRRPRHANVYVSTWVALHRGW